jgi:hypothetical protein
MPVSKVIKTILLLLFCWIYKPALAQDYRGAIGGRFGYGVGLTGVYVLNGGQALEFLLRYGYHGLILNKPGANIQVLYEKHWEIGRRGNWTVYLGGGPALGFGKLTSESKEKLMALGISPIGGIDYTTQNLRIPLILSFDYKPTLNTDFVIGRKAKPAVTFSYYEIAFSVRIGIR